MTDCCLCVCFRPRTYKRLIKDVFQSNYQYRNELILQHFSKGKYERLIQYMVNYPSKLSLILMKLESKFVKFYLRHEISQLLLVIEIMKGVIQDYSKRSLQHLLETHLLFFINESLQTKEIVLLQAITLLLKECIKYQVFYNYNTFVGLATAPQSLQQGTRGHFNEDERVTQKKSTKTKKELISLPYTKDEHYDFILYILYLCNNIIHQQKLQKLKECNEKEIELQSSITKKKTLKPEKKDLDDYNYLDKEEEEKIIEEEEGKEDHSNDNNDDFHDFSKVTSNFPLSDETDPLTCLGLTMIITIFGLFRSQGNNLMSSSPTSNLYLNHIHNTNNKYFYIILQTIIKLLIFITPTIDKQSIYTAFPKLTNNEMMNKIFQDTRKLLQQQQRQQQQQGNSNGSTNNTSDSAAFDTLESPETNNMTVTVSFLIWKIIKLYFHYQTIHESSLLYDQMIFIICNTFYQCNIPLNSSLFLRLQYFIYKSYQSSYYHSNPQHHHQASKGMSGNTVPPILFFRIESVLCKFMINTIYTKTQHSSDSFILKRDYLEQKNAIEKNYKKKNKSSGKGGNVNDDPLIRIQLLQLQYKYYYQQYETIPTIIQLTTELNDFQSFLFDGSELFQRQIQQHFHFLQDSLSFLFLYLHYFLKVSPYQEKNQSHATTTTADINTTSSSFSAPTATTATSRNHIDSLIQFNYYIQIILSYLMKTNDNYFYSKDLLKKNNEFFTNSTTATHTTNNNTVSPEGESKDAAIGKKEKNDEDNVFLSSIRRSFHYRNGDQGGASAGALAESGATGAPVSSKGFLSSYNKYLSTSNRTTSQDSVHDDEITRIIDEEGLLRSSRSVDSATGQRKPFQQKNKKKYELILDDDDDENDKNDPNEGSEVVNISRSLDLTTFTTEPSIKIEDKNKNINKVKTEKTEKQLKHEEILDNIIFLIYEIMKTFTQHSLYQFQLNANITMVLDIVLQKTVSIEKALFLHQITPSMPVVDGGMMLNPIVGRVRAGSSNALKRTVSSAGLSLMSHSKDYRKHYQLQYFYYYSFSLLELILSNISINYSSIIIFSLEEAVRNSRLHDPSSEIPTPTTSSLLMTPTIMMSLESLLKSFEEMECFQQILLFIMKVMTLFSVLMMNNHFPDVIVQQIILHQESTPDNSSALASSSSFKSSSLLTREQRAIYQKQILKFINEMTSSITVHEQIAENRGLNLMPATAYFTLTEGAVNEGLKGNKGVISERLYEFLFQRLLFYPYSINEFHSFLSIIFNHLMNLSSDYYIPKLVFYWNFHIYLTLLIGENCLITTITMFHKILSLLPILENNLIQKNFLYYYIIQYFLFISQLIYDDSLSSFLKQSYLSQLSYMNIIKENIGIEPLLSSSSSSKKQEGLSLMILLKYTRTFYYNAHRVPVPPKVRNVMQEGEGSEKKKGLSTMSKGIYALQSTYVINQSIYVKDIHINLSEIVSKLMNNEILKQYSFELTEALTSNFVPFDPSSNIFLHLKKRKEKEEEKEKSRLAELHEFGKEKRNEEEKVVSVPTVRKLFPLEDNTESKEDDNDQSDAQSVSSHNSHASNSSHASSSSQRKAKKSGKRSKKGSNKRDSTHLIRESLEADQENKVDTNSGIESDLNQEDLTTKRVMKKRRPTMDVMKQKTGKNKRRGSNNTDDSEIGEDDEEEVERGTIATAEERSEASGKSHKSKKSIKSSRSKQSHRSNRSTRSVKSSLTTISQKKEFKDIYDLMYNDTKHEDELKSVITGATSALPSRHNHGVESIQEESHGSHRASSDRGLDKNHRTINWRHFYHQKSREYHSQIVQSKDHDQLINVLESL